MHVLHSFATMINSRISNATHRLLESVTASVTLQNCTFIELMLGERSLVSTEEESTLLIENSTFGSVVGTASILKLQDTSANLSLVKITGTQSIRGVHGSTSTIVIARSSFSFMFSTDLGGAILLKECNGTIEDSTFEKNTAKCGGAVFYSCLDENSLGNCELILARNAYRNNTAIDSGGAIAYDLYQPQDRGGPSIFESNNAPYGKDIASYGASISGPEERLLQDIASSQIISTPLEISLLDMDQNLINTDNSSYCYSISLLF